MPYDAAGESLTIATYDGRTPRPLFLIDPRSIGKVVVLKQISETARRNLDWATVHIDVTPRDLIATLIAQLKVAEEPPSRRVSLACDENVLTPTLRDQLRITVESAERQVVGLLVSLDNQHHTTSSEMDELGSILQEIAPENRPLVIMMSALARSGGGKTSVAVCPTTLGVQNGFPQGRIRRPALAKLSQDPPKGRATACGFPP